MAEYNIDSIVMPNGETQEITAIVMPNGDEYTFGGGVTPTGNINITQAGVTDVTNYATATVPVADHVAEIFVYGEVGLNVSSDGEVYGTLNSIETYPYYTADGWVNTDYGVVVEVGAGANYQLPTQAATTITPTTSAQTAVAAGKWTTGAVTVAAMPNGSATPAASISGTSATVSTGTNTLTLSKTVSNTPQVSAGYVSSGTAGNSSVSLTANVTTKAAATITPGTTNQTIASGTYLTGTQTISGDANLVAGNIKSGTSIFGVTGTYSGGGGTLTVATKTASLSAVGQTLSFTGLLGTPKYWFVKTTSQISSSGSTTIYYITDGFWDGTSVKGNSFRIGSTRRIYSWTAGVSQSYSGGTLTITGGSATGASPGQFFNGNYELTYVY